MLLALCMVFALCACGQSAAPAEQPALAGCRSLPDAAPAEDAAADEATGSVYYLNFKPEQDEQWKALAASYTEQTGVPVTVVTAASGTYEETLAAEMAKSEAPTLFRSTALSALANWKDYCYDSQRF